MKRKILSRELSPILNELENGTYSIDGEVVSLRLEARDYSIEELESILNEMRIVQGAHDDGHFEPADRFSEYHGPDGSGALPGAGIY